MLENSKATRPQAATDEDEMWTVARAAMAAGGEIDNELQAAIEYKIALAGANGADKVLELLNTALKRQIG